MENISVSVRLRALSKLEEQERCVWKVDGRCVIHIEGDNRRDADCRRDTDARRSSTYAADYVFGPESTNEQVYREAVEALVHDAVEGKSVTIMVYGQTGSGKTHTMGTPSNPGIIQRGLVDIFELITEKENRDFLLRFSFLEIYNENVTDLLNPERFPKPLLIKEDRLVGPVVLGLSEEIVTCPEEVLRLLRQGEARRHVASSKMNERSNRSHTVCRMVIESRPTGCENTAQTPVIVSSLVLVDLAGSESVAKTGAEGERLKESSCINKSLLALGEVVFKLSEGALASGAHIPYRDSKLTRILKPSLGGNAKTMIICTINPAARHCEESHRTLRFACRAKRVVNNVVVQEVMSDAAAARWQAKALKELQRRRLGGMIASSEDARAQIRALRMELMRTEEERAKAAREAAVARQLMVHTFDMAAAVAATASETPARSARLHSQSFTLSRVRSWSPSAVSMNGALEGTSMEAWASPDLQRAAASAREMIAPSLPAHSQPQPRPSSAPALKRLRTRELPTAPANEAPCIDTVPNGDQQQLEGSPGAEAEAETCGKTEVGELPQSVAQATAPQPRPPAAGTGLQLKQQIGSVGRRSKRPPNVPLQLQEALHLWRFERGRLHQENTQLRQELKPKLRQELQWLTATIATQEALNAQLQSERDSALQLAEGLQEENAHLHHNVAELHRQLATVSGGDGGEMAVVLAASNARAEELKALVIHMQREVEGAAAAVKDVQTRGRAALVEAHERVMRAEGEAEELRLQLEAVMDEVEALQDRLRTRELGSASSLEAVLEDAELWDSQRNNPYHHRLGGLSLSGAAATAAVVAEALEQLEADMEAEIKEQEQKDAAHWEHGASHQPEEHAPWGSGERESAATSSRASLVLRVNKGENGGDKAGAQRDERCAVEGSQGKHMETEHNEAGRENRVAGRKGIRAISTRQSSARRDPEPPPSEDGNAHPALEHFDILQGLCVEYAAAASAAAAAAAAHPDMTELRASAKEAQTTAARAATMARQRVSDEIEAVRASAAAAVEEATVQMAGVLAETQEVVARQEAVIADMQGRLVAALLEIKALRQQAQSANASGRSEMHQTTVTSPPELTTALEAALEAAEAALLNAEARAAAVAKERDALQQKIQVLETKAEVAGTAATAGGYGYHLSSNEAEERIVEDLSELQGLRSSHGDNTGNVSENPNRPCVKADAEDDGVTVNSKVLQLCSPFASMVQQLRCNEIEEQDVGQRRQKLEEVIRLREKLVVARQELALVLRKKSSAEERASQLRAALEECQKRLRRAVSENNALRSESQQQMAELYRTRRAVEEREAKLAALRATLLVCELPGKQLLFSGRGGGGGGWNGIRGAALPNPQAAPAVQTAAAIPVRTLQAHGPKHDTAALDTKPEAVLTAVTTRAAAANVAGSLMPRAVVATVPAGGKGSANCSTVAEGVTMTGTGVQGTKAGDVGCLKRGTGIRVDNPIRESGQLPRRSGTSARRAAIMGMVAAATGEDASLMATAIAKGNDAANSFDSGAGTKDAVPQAAPPVLQVVRRRAPSSVSTNSVLELFKLLNLERLHACRPRSQQRRLRHRQHRRVQLLDVKAHITSDGCGIHLLAPRLESVDATLSRPSVGDGTVAVAGPLTEGAAAAQNVTFPTLTAQLSISLRKA